LRSFDYCREGVSNFTQLLVEEAVQYVGRGGNAPYFLYWAPDSTHTPSYSSIKFKGTMSQDFELAVVLRFRTENTYCSIRKFPN
jgi:hypothetical protein